MLVRRVLSDRYRIRQEIGLCYSIQFYKRNYKTKDAVDECQRQRKRWYEVEREGREGERRWRAVSLFPLPCLFSSAETAASKAREVTIVSKCFSGLIPPQRSDVKVYWETKSNITGDLQSDLICFSLISCFHYAWRWLDRSEWFETMETRKSKHATAIWR